MKRISWWFLGLALASPLAHARDLAAIKASGQVVIATEGATPPFNYFENGKLTGFEVELGNALARRLGVNVKWVTAPFDTLLIGLAQERYDFVIAGHGITPERQKAVDFSDPYVCSGGAIISRAGGPRKQGDLKGKTVAVQVGTTYLTAVQKVPGVGSVKTFPKDTDALQNLLVGRVDAWVSDRLTAVLAAQKQPAAGLQVGDLLYTERYGMAFRKGNATLRTAVNGALRSMLNDGSYAKLSTRYFEEDIRCR